MKLPLHINWRFWAVGVLALAGLLVVSHSIAITMQLKTGRSSSNTVQAPQAPCSHPCLVPAPPLAPVSRLPPARILPPNSHPRLCPAPAQTPARSRLPLTSRVARRAVWTFKPAVRTPPSRSTALPQLPPPDPPPPTLRSITRASNLSPVRVPAIPARPVPTLTSPTPSPLGLLVVGALQDILKRNASCLI